MRAEAMAGQFGTTPFELRYDVFGRCAVRVAGGGVLERHVEPAPAAPFALQERCGTAVGWVLAAAAPDDPERVGALLRTAVAQRTALVRERQARALAALAAELLEALTHRLRTDVMTLSTVAEGALQGMLGGDTGDVIAELRRTGAEAQRRITAAREVMTVLAAGPDAEPERVAATLRAELEGAGRDPDAVSGADGEEAWTRIGGAGWAACARALAADERWSAFAVAPDPEGWRVTAEAAGRPAVPCREPVAHIVVAAGGRAETENGRITLVLPAAPGSG